MDTLPAPDRRPQPKRPLLRVAAWTALTIIVAAIMVEEVVIWPRMLDRRFETLQKRQEELERQIASLRALLHPSGSGAAPAPGESLFRIYGPDREMRRDEVVFSIVLPDSMPVLEKLRVLADKLSTYQFSGMPIEVVKIEKYGGRNIAVVDLREPAGNSARSWKTAYFDDRITGYFTGVSLRKTFLQEEYAGPWVDGVEFTYNDQPLFNDWPHVGISGTILRQTR